MNVITVAGQLGKDAELKYMQNGDPIASFSVADSQGKDKQTIWWRCSLFGKRADSLANYLLKGQAVTVTGVVTEREYTDKDGNQKKAQEIRVNDVALQGGKKDSHATVAAPAPRTQARPAPAPASSGFDDMSDDVPF